MTKSTTVATNLRVLRPSRKPPQVGDLFRMRLPDGTYLFGRVVDTNANAGGFPNAVLLYVYSHRSATPEPPGPALLRPHSLLIPPVMTNRLPWSKGYFETIVNLPLEPGEKLPQHCFESFGMQRYFDERGRELKGRVEPCGQFGLHSYRTIDDAISETLGLPLAPD